MAVTTVPSQTSGSASIQQRLVAAQAGLGSDIYEYNKARSIWGNAISRGTFPPGQTDLLKSIMYQRARVNTNGGRGTWASHTMYGLSSATAGNSPPDISTSRGLPPVSVVQSNALIRQYGLDWGAVESERIDVRNEVFNAFAQKQFEKQMGKLVEGADAMWDYKQREAYFRLCNNKVVVGKPESGSSNIFADLGVKAPQTLSGMLQYSLAQLNATGSTVGSGYSTNHSVLTNGILQQMYEQMALTDASRDSRLRGAGGMASYPLVCSSATSAYLRREPGIREDLRNGDAGSLLKGLGFNTSFLGFTHVIDNLTPRFTLALNGSYYDFTEVLPYGDNTGTISTAFSSAATASSATATTLTVTSSTGIVAGSAVALSSATADYAGTFTVLSVDSSTTITIAKAFTATASGNLVSQTLGRNYDTINTSYLTAPYEMSFILHPQVMRTLTMQYPTSLGSGSSFDPTKNIGDFKWINEFNEDTNPDKTMGYFRGIMEFAAEPMNTEYGWAIIHRRADPVVLASPTGGASVISGLGLWA